MLLSKSQQSGKVSVARLFNKAKPSNGQGFHTSVGSLLKLIVILIGAFSYFQSIAVAQQVITSPKSISSTSSLAPQQTTESHPQSFVTVANSVHWSLGSVVADGEVKLTNEQNHTALSATGVIVNRFNVEDARVGWKFNLGFDLTSNFAIRAGYLDLNELNADNFSLVHSAMIPQNQQVNAKYFHKNLNPEGFSLGSVYRYHLTDSLDVTGSLGVFNWHETKELQLTDEILENNPSLHSGTDIYFGVGGGYQVTEEVSLSVEWEHYKLDDEDTDMLSIGVNYHF